MLSGTSSTCGVTIATTCFVEHGNKRPIMRPSSNLAGGWNPPTFRERYIHQTFAGNTRSGDKHVAKPASVVADAQASDELAMIKRTANKQAEATRGCSDVPLSVEGA